MFNLITIIVDRGGMLAQVASLSLRAYRCRCPRYCLWSSFVSETIKIYRRVQDANTIAGFESKRLSHATRPALPLRNIMAMIHWNFYLFVSKSAKMD